MRCWKNDAKLYMRNELAYNWVIQHAILKKSSHALHSREADFFSPNTCGLLTLNQKATLRCPKTAKQKTICASRPPSGWSRHSGRRDRSCEIRYATEIVNRLPLVSLSSSALDYRSVQQCGLEVVGKMLFSETRIQNSDGIAIKCVVVL